MNESVVIYKSFYVASKVLNSEDFKDYWIALFDYALDGIEPTFNSPMVEALFIMAKPQIDANIKRRIDGCKGGRPKKNNGFENEKPMVLENAKNKKPNVNVNVNDNVNVLLYTKPTLEKVEEFVKENNLNKVNSKEFFNHYQFTNWKDGQGEVIKNWKLTLLAWEKKAETKKSKSGFKDFSQRTYDFEELEKQLLNG